MTIVLHNDHQRRLGHTLARNLDWLLLPNGVAGKAAMSFASIDQFKKSTIDPLFEIKSVTFQGFITIEYFNFPQWLAVNLPSPYAKNLNAVDPRNPPKDVVERDIDKWRAEREAYLGTKDPSVLFQLGKISGSFTGAALLRALQKATKRGKALSIFPDNAPTVPSNVATFADRVASSNRTGADAYIDYSPELWGQSTDMREPIGPGSAPDDILFHELVHATRCLTGVRSTQELHNKRFFPSVEEYLAVVLTNIYISETKPLAPLRGGYDPPDPHPGRGGVFRTLPRPERFLDNLDHLVPSPRQLLQTLYTDQRELYDDLAFWDTILFNPIAQLERKKNPDNFRFGTGFDFVKSMIQSALP